MGDPGRAKASKRFFFEKKNQKTFIHWHLVCHGEGEARLNIIVLLRPLHGRERSQ
jgi:hypothetical protein